MAHPLPVNLDTMCSSNGTLYCVSEWAYNVTEGLFWTIILLAFIIVLFMASQKFGTTRAFGFASFVGLLGSVFLVTLNLIPYWIASAFILTGVIGLAVMVIGNSEG